MNKRVVDKEIDSAYHLLAKHEIAKNGKIDNTYRGQIASFGAAITMGSLLSAVAYFSKKGDATVDRTKILDAIYDIVNEQCENENLPPTLFDYVRDRKSKGLSAEKACKEDVLNAAIALKLAMNLYELVDTTKNPQEGQV